MESSKKKRLGWMAALAIVSSLSVVGIAAAASGDDAAKDKQKQCDGGGHHEDHAKDDAKYDTNGDGKLDDAERAKMREEHEKRREEHVQEHFARLDADKNGAISRDEAKAFAPLAEHFDEVDSDKNGAISLDELRAAAPKHGRHHGERGSRNDQGERGK